MTGAPAVLVMAKLPRPGSVKTRLAPLLGHDGCARLQALLVRRATELACSVAPGATYVAFDPADGEAEMARLVLADVLLLPQRGTHLGERLANATGEVLAARSGPLVVVGTDIPLLAPVHLCGALGELEAGRDAVFGPACDGGYYLAGLARALPELFAIDPALWGGPQVLRASLARARAAGISVGLLEPLRDLDTAEDASALLAEPELPHDVRQVLAGGVEAVSPGAST